MTRKEEILLATLDLAAERGLKAVTLSQIAERVGIRKPSLYNHFKSKEEILQEAYQFLREQARAHSGLQAIDAIPSVDKSLEEILLRSFEQYSSFVLDQEMLQFFKVLYAERSTSPMAAQIMVDETNRMIQQVKALFYDLAVHGKLYCDDVDMAATSFACTIHTLVDLQMDKLTAGESALESKDTLFPEAKAYISWFARQMEPSHE